MITDDKDKVPDMPTNPPSTPQPTTTEPIIDIR